MKIVKWFVIFVFTAVILAAGAVYVVLTYYRSDLEQRIISELKARYDIDIAASSTRVSLFSNWPHASLQLMNVKISQGKFPGSFIEARSLSLSFNIERMLQRQFIVHQAVLSGGTIEIVKPPEAPPQPSNDTTAKKNNAQFELQRVALRNCVLHYANPANGQDFRIDLHRNEVRISTFSDGMYAEVTGETRVRGLQFRANRGHFLVKSSADLDVKLAWLKDSKSLCIRPGSFVRVNDQHFDVAGVALFGDKKRLGLIIGGTKLNYRETVKLLSNRLRKILNNFDMDGPFDGRVVLLAAIGRREEPAFVVHVAGNNNDLRIGTSKVPYSGLQFAGRIVCVDSSHVRGDIAHAYVEFAGVRGRIYELPFVATVKVSNLINPYIRIQSALDIQASKLNFAFAKNFDMHGNAKAMFRYAGPAERLDTRQFLDHPMRLSASIRFHNFSFREKSSVLSYTLNGDASAGNRDVQLERIRVSTLAGTAIVKGRAEGLIKYIFGFKPGFKTDLTVTMDTLNLNPLLSALSKPDTAARNSAAIRPVNDRRLANAANALDKSLETFEFNVRLNADRFYVRNLQASRARMHLKYRKGRLDFPVVEMRTCDGRLRADGHIDQYKTLAANVNINDVDVTELFRQFENFGQSVVVSDNLKGRLHLEASFNTHLDHRLSIAPETMFADVRLKLRDGHLLNFEPVQNLASFLFRNRDFNDVSFSELNEAFVLRGPLLEISELEIASSLLNVYVVNGIYNFQGPSLINVLVPWNNLRKRESGFQPKRSGVNAETAKGVKLNFYGTPNHMKLGLGHRELFARRSSI